MHSRKYISSHRYYILQNYLILLVIANYDNWSAKHKNNNRGLCDLVCQVGGRALYIYSIRLGLSDRHRISFPVRDSICLIELNTLVYVVCVYL